MNTQEFIEHVKLERQIGQIGHTPFRERADELREKFKAMDRHAPLEISLELHAIRLHDGGDAEARYNQLQDTQEWKDWKQFGTVIKRRA